MADQWLKGKPAGSDNASDIDTLVQSNNASLDRMLYNYKAGCALIPASVSTVTILTGELAIPNADGSVVKMRRITSNVTVGWGDLDTGSETAATLYYVYAIADADATTFTAKVSTNSSAPSGVTYYRRLGPIYNNSASDIITVGNDVGNANDYGAAKAWCKFAGTTTGTNSPTSGYNVVSVERISAGVYTITFMTAFANTDYIMVGSVKENSSDLNNVVRTAEIHNVTTAKTTTTCKVRTGGTEGQGDMEEVNLVFFGTQ